MMWVSVAFAVMVTFLFGRGAMSSVLSTTDQTLQSRDSLQPMRKESEVFASPFHRRLRTTSESSDRFGDIDLGDSVKREEDLPYFINCAQFPLRVDVSMIGCQPNPILLCFTDTATGTELGSLSSDHAPVYHSYLPFGEKLEAVLSQFCDTNDRNNSGAKFEIPGEHHLLGASNSVTIYAVRFPACNATMLKLANEARKTVTLRIKSCFPPRTTSTAPTAKYTSLETTAERENGSITLNNITTNFSVITTMAPADTNIDTGSAMSAKHVTVGVIVVVTVGVIVVVAVLMGTLILAICKSR